MTILFVVIGSGRIITMFSRAICRHRVAAAFGTGTVGSAVTVIRIGKTFCGVAAIAVLVTATLWAISAGRLWTAIARSGCVDRYVQWPGASSVLLCVLH